MASSSKYFLGIFGECPYYTSFVLTKYLFLFFFASSRESLVFPLSLAYHNLLVSDQTHVAPRRVRGFSKTGFESFGQLKEAGFRRESFWPGSRQGPIRVVG